MAILGITSGLWLLTSIMVVTVTYVGNHNSCEERPYCPQSVCLDTLWDGHNQCVGDTFFYRRLTQPTTDNIEMRICRDEDRANKDILITKYMFSDRLHLVWCVCVCVCVCVGGGGIR